MNVSKPENTWANLKPEIPITTFKGMKNGDMFIMWSKVYLCDVVGVISDHKSTIDNRKHDFVQTFIRPEEAGVEDALIGLCSMKENNLHNNFRKIDPNSQLYINNARKMYRSLTRYIKLQPGIVKHTTIKAAKRAQAGIGKHLHESLR